MSDDVESIQIHLNSKFATNYYNNSFSNCDFYLPVIEIPPQHHIYISVILANIPYSFYNIDNNNNILYYYVDSNLNTVIITPGNYNAYQIATYLQNNMQGFKVYYNNISNKFTFENSISPFSFNSTSTCLEILGFKSTDNAIFRQSSAGLLTSNWVANMQSKHCICVQINYQTGNLNISNKLTNNILASIPISGQPYSMITYRNSNSGFRSNLYTCLLYTSDAADD